MKLHRFIGMLGAALFLGLMAGCSDDDVVTPLDKTDMTIEDATYSTLTFHWDKVDGARQYSYQFAKSGSEDILQTGLTKDTNITFTGLEPDTEYTLTVLAYAAVGSANTTSEPIVLTARTADLTSLSAPVLSYTREGNSIIVEWDAVEGARDYAYTFTDSEGNEISSGSTFDTYATFQRLQTADYTVSVVAQTYQDGYRNSDAATLEINFVREREELWRTTGTYKSGLLNQSWDATLVAYDDNSFVLLAWYGVDGYDIDFSIDESDASNMFRLAEGYTYNSSTDSYAVPTGSTPATIDVYASGNQSAYQGNSGKGSVVLTVASGTTKTTDTFRWGISIEDFAGEWTLDFAGKDAWGDSSYDVYENRSVTVTVGSDPNTLMIPLFTYEGHYFGNAKITVDMDEMTFTMQPVTNAYTLAGAASDTATLTGTISFNKIEFDNVQLWYYGYSYLADDSYLRYTR